MHRRLKSSLTLLLIGYAIVVRKGWLSSKWAINHLSIKKLLISFSSIVFCSMGYSQEELSPTISVVPPSPEVMAMNKHTEIPVSYYTGLPQISVPIFNIEMNNIQIPISLDYHASGLRVSEYSSSVGAGWSLSTTGVISRTIKGKPDERIEQTYQGYFYASNWLDSNGYLKNSVYSDCTLDPTFSYDDNGTQEYATPVNPPDFLAMGWWDTQPDEYHFSLPGGPSGKFLFNHMRELIKLTPSDIEFIDHPFEYSVNAATYQNDYYWKIKDSNGTTYTFQLLAETTTSSNICANVTQMTIEDVPIVDHEYEDNQTSWFLTRIENGDEWVSFGYNTEHIIEEYNTSSTFKEKIEGGDPSYETQCIMNATRDTYRVASITASNGYQLIFSYDLDAREDLAGSHRMEKIIVRFNSEPVKSFRLDNDHYFGNNDKLKLEKVEVLDQVGTGNKVFEYAFDYFETQSWDFPEHNTAQQDYWGFYNGVSSNSSSILPEWWNDDYHINENSSTSREPVLQKAKIGTLSKITYPTGGTAEFEYELHDYSGPNTWEQFSHSVFADGEQVGEQYVIDYDSVEFTVNQDCSISFFFHQFPQEGLDAGYYFKQWDDSSATWVDYTPGTRYGQSGVTTAFRKNIDSGKYLLTVESWGSPIDIEVKFEEQGNVGFQRAGGLRVKKITHTDPVTGTNTHSIFKYTLEGKSSGKLLSDPINEGYITKFAKALTNEMGGYCNMDVPTYYLNLASYAQLPLATVNGSHVGYSRVEVHKVSDEVLDNYYPPSYSGYRPEFSYFQALDGEGFEVYEYLNEYPPNTEYNTQYPYIPFPKVDFVNGSLFRKQVFQIDTVYSTEFGRYIYQPLLQAETINEYDTLSVDYLRSYVFRRFLTTRCYECSYGNSLENTYEHHSRKVRLKQTINKSFEGGKELEQLTIYNYDYPTHSEIDSKTIEIDDGDALVTHYERDIANPKLIKEVNRFRNGTKISGEKIQYDGTLPGSYYKWNHETSQFELSKTIQWDEGFPVHVIDGVNSTSRGTYLYNQKQVVAAISNIDTTEVAYKLTQITPQPTQNYTIDWLKTEQDAFIIDHVLSSLRGLLDKDQHMTTYLYQDGSRANGPVEIIDPNGRSQKFEYDSFGRLHKVLDHEGHVLKKIEYTYKNN